MLTRPAATGFAINAVTGTLNHNATVTLDGAGFGTKSTAAPYVYDDASGSNPVATGWSEAWPDAATGGANYNMAYRTPASIVGGSGPALPHSRITKYICGAHNAGSGNTGASVHLSSHRTGHTRPAYTFASWWYRWDATWVFDDPSVNNKVTDWGVELGGYDLPDNWYLEYGSGGNSWISTAHADNNSWWHINSDSVTPAAPGPLQDPDANGHDWNDWDDAYSPFSGWVKVEYAVKWINDATGFVKIWDNGVLKVNYAGSTDGTTGDWANSTRYDMLGGYSNDRDAKNWRYMCDVYYDRTLSRVILGNASTIAACTIKEPQVPSAWSDTSIDVKVKLGALTNGATAWLYVYNAAGTATAGKQVTLGS